MSEPVRRALPPSVFARLSDAARYVITGVSPDTWFGPLQPLAPMAPPEVKGRQWDYPFGANLNYIPRSDDGVSFGELRSLADALPLLRAVIETRKDQIAAQSYAIRPRAHSDAPSASKNIDQVTCFLARPDRRHSFADWLRMLLEDMLVIDAATLYPRYNRGGSLYALDVIDGATIKPLIGEDGRLPDAPDPAYQQILKGVPAADFSAEELLYIPRNPRAHRLYGMSPVEQIALTINIALRRDASTLDYYRAGSSPDAFATLPKEWTADQIRSFQDYFDALMSGNLARRRQTKFMPADFKLIEARQPPLKDQYDEWLARLICYAFSVPVSPFVSQVNRATSETLRQQATQEGLVPLKAWVKNALDHVIQECMNEPALEFVWVGDDAVDPLQQAQTLNNPGRRGHQDARGGAGGLRAGGGGGARPPAGLGKSNSNHDEQGRFSTAEDAVAVVGHPARKPRPTGVQVASNSDATVRSDAGPSVVAQAEGEDDEEPRPDEAGDNGIIEYFDPDTGRIVPYPATAIPPQGWVDMRSLPDPSKPTYFEPLGGTPTGGSAAATPSSAPSGVTPSGTAENPSDDFNSEDQDEDVGFESTRGPRFANDDLLSEHFQDHRYDFDAETESEYEDLAASFLTNQHNLDILELTRPSDNAIVRFNPETNEFGILSEDGDIVTYFKPDPREHGFPTNLDYFNAQKGRRR